MCNIYQIIMSMWHMDTKNKVVDVYLALTIVINWDSSELRWS